MAANTTYFLGLSTAYHSETNDIVVSVIVSSVTDRKGVCTFVYQHS